MSRLCPSVSPDTVQRLCPVSPPIRDTVTDALPAVVDDLDRVPRREPVTMLRAFGHWPSSHDLDLAFFQDEKTEQAIRRRAAALGLDLDDSDLRDVPVDLDDIPELAPVRAQLDALLARYGVPLDVFLGFEPDFNLALWIEPGGKALLSWRYCGRYFFDGAEPLGANLRIPDRNPGARSRVQRRAAEDPCATSLAACTGLQSRHTEASDDHRQHRRFDRLPDRRGRQAHGHHHCGARGRRGHHQPAPAVWYRVAQELRGVVRRREGSLAALEADLMNDDGPGAIVEPGSDSVAQAQAELREALRRDVEGGS